MRYLFLPLLLMSLAAGCDDEETAKAIDLARKQSEQASQQIQAAQQEVQHVQRLRDIDRTRLDTEKGQAQAEVTAWRGSLVCLSLILAGVLVWLSRELRLRRIVSHILLAQKNRGDG